MIRKTRNSRLLGLIAGLITMAVLVSCGGGAGGVIPGTESKGSVTGKVAYSNLKDASGITVVLEKTDGLTPLNVVGTTSVKKDGKFTFNDVEDGLYNVYASSYASTEKAVYTNVRVADSKATTIAETLKLTATGDISGKVQLDGTDTGNAGFTVGVAGTSYTAITDEKGNYTISGVPVNTGYKIVIVKGNFTYILTKTVDVTAKTTTTVDTCKVTTDQIGANNTGTAGEKGDTGATGAQGEKGETGAQGEKGEKGDTGAQGEKGEKGDTGAQGEKGDTGAAGADGKDGVSIKWLGFFDSADEIKEPALLDAYYNTTDGCSYIYDGTVWQILAKAGKDGEDFVNTAKKELYLENILIYNRYGQNYHNSISFLEDTSILKQDDTVRIEMKFVSKKDADFNLYLVDKTEAAGYWKLLAESQTVTAKANQVTSATFEQSLTALPIGTGAMSSVLNIVDGDATENVKLIFTQFDVYINDEYIDTNPDTVDKSAETYISIDDKYNIGYSATDRGIRFETKILSNTKYDGSNIDASVTFTFVEQESGIELIRNWVKTANNWTTCETYYPFVNAGKTYTFTVKASQSDYTIYEKVITVKATGGLGEFRIENKDDYDVELTADRVMHLTGKPEFTDNEKVHILRQRILYELYDSNWSWLYNKEAWLDTTDGVLSLKDPSNWRSYNYFDACLSGRQYMARARTEITVAGYQDNGQTYFYMADQKNEIKDWGGEIAKVLVVNYADPEKIGGLSGETKLFTFVQGGNSDTSDTRAYNVSSVNFFSSIYEPIEVPYVKDCESSVFTNWLLSTNGNISEAKFPYFVPDIGITVENGEIQYFEVDGEKYIGVLLLAPIINATYKVKIMDGDKEFATTTALVKNVTGVAGVDNYTLEITPKKEGYVFEGLYADKELTKQVTKITENNMTVYIKWIKVETLFESGSEDLFREQQIKDSKLVAALNTGDTLYVELVNPNSYSASGDIRVNDCGFYGNTLQESFYLEKYETKVIQVQLTNESIDLLRKIRQNGLNLSTNWWNIYIKGIYLNKVSEEKIVSNNPQTVYFNQRWAGPQFYLDEEAVAVEIYFDEVPTDLNFVYYSDVSEEVTWGESWLADYSSNISSSSVVIDVAEIYRALVEKYPENDIRRFEQLRMQNVAEGENKVRINKIVWTDSMGDEHHITLENNWGCDITRIEL